jgi:proteic killer suppression protein
VIVSIRHKGLKLLWEKGSGSGLPQALVPKISMVMQLINRAKVVEDVNFPGSNLHPLKGGLKGFWAVRISANYRLIFRFDQMECHAMDLDYVDYH